MQEARKKAIITGVTGGLGRNLASFLIEKGWEVLGCGRNQEIGASLECRFKSFDLSDLSETLDAFEEADIVFHCAARSSPWGAYALFYQDNVVATQNVLKAMEKYSIQKLVYVSTPSLYFDFTMQRGITESYRPHTFVNAYAKTKFEAEQLVLDSAFDVSVIRPRGIFGEHDTVLIPRLEKIAKKGFMPLPNAGKALTDITYVGNVVYAMYLCATKHLPAKSVFNITNDQSIEIGTLFKQVMQSIDLSPKYINVSYKAMYALATSLEWIAKLSKGKEPMLTRYSIGVISYDQTLDITKAKEILGYRPLYTIEEGLERYAQSRD